MSESELTTAEKIMIAAGINPGTCKSFVITWNAKNGNRLEVIEGWEAVDPPKTSFKPLDRMQTK